MVELVEGALCEATEGDVRVRDTVDKLDRVQDREVDPRGWHRRQMPVVISTRLETGFSLTMEVETEKVSRATSM